MSALPPPAPHTAADAAEYLAMRARLYEETAIAEHAERDASAKRVGFTRRMAAYYRLGAEALTPPAAEPSMEDMLS